MAQYNPSEIESKWQARWEKEKLVEVDLKEAKRPFYNLMMFPYPSAEGLHVGHVYAFGGSDTFGRFKRLKGFDVFEPMGFDAFGIHSENYAIKVGKHPKELIEETTTHYREEQLKKLGALFNWSHQVNTTQSNYYKWTQWLFIQLFKSGLAVRKKAEVDWCPSCKTVLADEQVISGACERCGTQVIQKELEQWFFKITTYAERLLKNLDKIDWSETTKTMQRNWIGRSEGTEINFKIKDQRLESKDITVFTTRPDTIYGATFMVLSPEHPLVSTIRGVVTGDKRQEIEKYLQEAKNKTEVERTSATKSGVSTGFYCINPLTGAEIPIFIADYVLMGYGTGAIMGVPAHDSRDWEFAKRYNLEIIEVINGGDVKKEAYVGEGNLVNSGEFAGLASVEAINKISEYIESNHIGKRTVNYHLRDWLISRQRYWGPPIPMIHCESCAKEGKSWFTTEEAKVRMRNAEGRMQSSSESMAGWYPVTEKDLPVELPNIQDFRPTGTGVSPLAQDKSFVKVACPGCGSEARRETDVSDTFLDSSWYFLRYPSVHSVHAEQVPFDKELTAKWLPVDMYIGGNEHAVLHLLYTRFVTMALNDLGLIDFEEPFKKFRAHGLIIHEGAKMSKSRGNVVNPNEYIDKYGADTLRMYLLFIGPYEQGGDFSDRAITGIYRYLNRVWTLAQEVSKDRKPDSVLVKKTNQLAKKVGEDLESLKFNTAIAALMEFTNEMNHNKSKVDNSVLKSFLITLAPLAPHLAEELWQKIGQKYSVHSQRWPKYEFVSTKEEKVTLVVQIDGKLRARLEVEGGKIKDKKELEKLVLSSESIKSHLSNKKIKKTIYVEGRLINFVTS